MNLFGMYRKIKLAFEAVHLNCQGFLLFKSSRCLKVGHTAEIQIGFLGRIGACWVSQKTPSAAKDLGQKLRNIRNINTCHEVPVIESRVNSLWVRISCCRS